MVRPRPEQTWLAGGLPQADGGVVLPPARLQIAVAAGLMESREVFGGGGSLPLGRSTGRAWGRGERQSNKGTKAVAGAGCWKGVPGRNPSQRQDTKPPKSPLESH